MTFEQAQLCVRLFILQHYDENIEDILPDVMCKGKVSDLICDASGNWRFGLRGFVFWANEGSVSYNNIIRYLSTEGNKPINTLDYINLDEEKFKNDLPIES